MARQSGGAGVSAAMLARLGVVPSRDAPHRVAILGDSRAASVAMDGAKRILGALSPFNWANALIGQRLTLTAMLGVSGERTDQMLARSALATASGAGLLYLHAGLNDIAQQQPSATTSGAVAAANLIAMARAGRAAGMRVVIEAEVGASNLTQPQVAQVHALNARLFAFAAQTPGVWIHDARAVMLDPGAAEGSTTPRAGFTYDGTHPSARGAQAWGRSLATLLAALVPPVALPLPASRADQPGNGRWQLARNPLFLDASGGVTGAGASGTVPAQWEARASTGASVAVSSGGHASAIGNRVTLSAGFGAAGQSATLLCDLGTAAALPGETVQAFAEVTILDPGALAGVYLELTQYTGTGGASIASCSLRTASGAGHAGPAAGDRLTLATLPYVMVPAVGANPFFVVQVRGEAIGAGNGAFAVDRVGVSRLEL